MVRIVSFIHAPTSTQRVVATTGSTVNVTQTNAHLALLLVPAGVLATLTVNLPGGSFDGQTCVIFSSDVLTALTVATTTGSIAGAVLSTLAANSSARYIWNTSSSTWYRLS